MTKVQELLYNKYIEESNIPKRYVAKIPLTVDPADYQTFTNLAELRKSIKTFVREGYNLYLWSNHVGNGKTTWSTILGKTYLEQYACNYAMDCPVFFINVQDFLMLRKSAMSDPSLNEKVQQMQNKIIKSKLCIFDDFNTNASEYDITYLYSLINERVANMRSSIYTSNMTPEELTKVLGARVADRVVGESIVMELKGCSCRVGRTFNGGR